MHVIVFSIDALIGLIREQEQLFGSRGQQSGTMRGILWILLVALLGFFAWATWYFRPTVEWTL